jgi:hypothetical protein
MEQESRQKHKMLPLALYMNLNERAENSQRASGTARMVRNAN